MATLVDIAAKAKVHPTTVSAILNQSKGNSRCSEKTRQRVLRIAADLGYVRNQLACRLRSRRTHTVCLIAGDIRNPFFAGLATAIEEDLEAHGYQMLMLCRGWGNGHHDSALSRALFEQPVDGFIVWSESGGKTFRQVPANFAKPIVTIGAPVKGLPGVRLDIGRGLKMALEYLAGKGHRGLAYYAPEEARSKGMPQPRHKIFQKLAADAGLPEPQVIFYPGKSWDIAAAADYARSVKLREDITAIVGFNDVAILGWRHLERARGMEMVSFDGTDWLGLCRDAVAHVRIPANALAKASVSMILSALEGGGGKLAASRVTPEFVHA